MEILDAKVDWKEDYGNSPRLQVLVDRIPSRDEIVFEYSPDEKLWYGEKNGFVEFFAGHPDEDGNGYGGRSFTLNTDNGQVVLNGPYSSRASVMNKNGFGPCVDVHITTDPNVLEKGHTFYSASITLEKAKEAIEYVEDAEGLRKSGGTWVPYR